jgi:phospholipase C
MIRRAALVLAAVCVALATTNGLSSTHAKASTPIQHVIVLYQENHSFDNVLGYWCQQTGHCIGMPATVTLKGGTVVTPTQAPDLVPQLDHSVISQRTALDGGAMDGWAKVSGCAAPTYSCISYYTPTQIPNLSALASNFAISDATFSEADSPSWGGHLYAVAATTDGFLGNNPAPVSAGPGWGCDSKKSTGWVSSSGAVLQEPSCIPDPSLGIANGGAFKATPVSYVPTIMDRLDAASLPWKFYATTSGSKTGGGSYNWATCPSFAECLDTKQRANLVRTDQVLSDAAAGTLPAFGLVLPGVDTVDRYASQHNGTSMAVGDNWIGKVVTALEASPEWSSTALFITYDDCGCFYDQVPPGLNPDGTQRGVRVPLVIVSPYAVHDYVDTTPTTFAGILAYVEQTFGLTHLGANDAAAYAFANAFNYSQPPIPPIPMRYSPVSSAALNAGANEANDPT